MATYALKKYRFNPVYFHLKKHLADHSVRRILIYGSSSAAKSYSASQALLVDGINNDYSSAFFRKESTTARTSIYNDIKEIVQEGFLNLKEAVGEYDLEYRYEDNKIVYKGLDKSDKAKGIKGFTKVYLDELDQFTKEDWDEMSRRLRGVKGQQIIASWNPVSQKHWIKKWIDQYKWDELPLHVDGEYYSYLHKDSFVKRSKDGRTILIKTTYYDNKWVVGGVKPDGSPYGFIDVQTLADFEDMRKNNPDDYRVYGLGLWGRVKNDSPFFYNLKRWEDVLDPEIKIREDLPVYISFDFNIDQCAATIGQIVPFECINIVDSLTAYGGTRELCKVIGKKYDPKSFHFLVTGDASGKQGSAIAGVNPITGTKLNNYSIIKEEFKIPDSKRRFLVNSANKSHFMSYNLCNDALYRIPTFFSPGSIELWDEMHAAAVEETSSGVVRLRKGPLEMNNRVDSFRYFIDCAFPNQIGKNDKTPKTVRLMSSQVIANFPELIEYYQSLPRAHKLKFGESA